MHTTNFKLLETKGFLVIPSFLSHYEVSDLLETYNKLKETSVSSNKNFPILHSQPNDSIKTKIRSLLNDIVQNSNIKVDLLIDGITYIDISLPENLSVFKYWHQDHDLYYQCQDLYNFVHCWIPIKKPQLDQFNLSLIPQDILSSYIPEIYQDSILGKGQFTFYPFGTKTIVEHHDSHKKFLIDVNIDTIQETPYVNAGDLVLYRGDVIHKTQSSNGVPDRISINIRSAYSETVVTKENFYSGGKFKNQFIENSPDISYEKIKSKFNEVDNFKLKDLN